MTKLTKAQIKERDEVCSNLRDQHEALEEALEKFNDIVAAAWAEHVDPALAKYNDAAQAAQDWKQGICDAIDGYVGERSEKWQEGDRAQAYDAWKSSYESEEIEQVEMEQPEPVEFDVDLMADVIEQLAEEVDG